MQYAKHTQVLRTPHQRDDGNFVDSEVVHEEQTVQPSAGSRIRQSVYTIYGLIAGLLLIRFAFALFGANPFNTVARTIYSLTRPLVAPFQSLFGSNTVLYKNARFEYDTLVAIAIYGLVAWLIARMVSIDRDAARHDEGI